MKLAVWYHGILSTPIVGLGDGALLIFCEQMAALRSSGLAEAADEIHIGMTSPDRLLAAALAPDQAVLHDVGPGDRGEQPTLAAMQRWLPGHEDWAICYHHMKGATHPPGDVFTDWRRCMQHQVILHWRRCVQDLQRGFDTVGAHWKVHVDQRYWAGNFWWATGAYLATLPAIPTNTVHGRSYESEVWIGRGPRLPRYLNYARHELMAGCKRGY